MVHLLSLVAAAILYLLTKNSLLIYCTVLFVFNFVVARNNCLMARNRKEEKRHKREQRYTMITLIQSTIHSKRKQEKRRKENNEI